MKVCAVEGCDRKNHAHGVCYKHYRTPPDGRCLIKRFRPQFPCGTQPGYISHIRKREPACDRCLRAHRIHTRANGIRHGGTKTVMVPIEALADLYLAAHPEAQQRIETELGVDVLDAVVDRYDNQSEESEVA